MVYDAISLERLTLNDKLEIRLIPTAQRKKSTLITVPYNGEVFSFSTFLSLTAYFFCIDMLTSLKIF